MAIHSSANPTNQRRSLEVYLETSFGGSNGIPTNVHDTNWWWPGRKIETKTKDYFVRVTYNEVGRQYYSRVGDSGGGYLVDSSLFIEVYAKRATYDANPHIIEQALAMFRASLLRGTSIPIKNYDDGDGSTTVARYTIETARPPQSQEEGVWRKGSWEVLLRHVEQDTGGD